MIPAIRAATCWASMPPARQMLQLAGEMPVRRPLSPAQLNAVVRFVMEFESGRS